MNSQEGRAASGDRLTYLVLVVDYVELLGPVGEVAGIDADLLEGLHHVHGHLGLKVDVRHQRDVVPGGVRGSGSGSRVGLGLGWCWG